MSASELFIGLYWGKARPATDGPAWLVSIARQSGLTADETRRRLMLVAAFHDLGKFAENFQWKAPEVFATLQPDADTRLTNSRGHGDVGHLFWDVRCLASQCRGVHRP